MENYKNKSNSNLKIESSKNDIPLIISNSNLPDTDELTKLHEQYE